jgi:hypothetical protein
VVQLSIQNALFSLVIASWLHMSVGVLSETIITRGVVSPISMSSFPSMETVQPLRSGQQPDIASSQIEILVPHETDIFDTIPSVSLWNHYRLNRHSWRHDYRWLKRNRRQI